MIFSQIKPDLWVVILKSVEQRSIKSKLLYSMSSSCTPPGLFPTKTHYSPFPCEMCQISLTAIWRVRIVLMLSRNSKSFDPHEHFTFYLQHYISSWVISCCIGAFYGCWKSSRMQKKKKKKKCVFFLLRENARHCGEWNLAVDLGGDGRFCWNGQKTSKLFNLLTEIFSHILCVCVFGTLTYFIFVDSNSLAGKQWLHVHPSVHSSTIHKNHYSTLRILVKL